MAREWVIRGVPDALSADMWWLASATDGPADPPRRRLSWQTDRARGQAAALALLVALADLMFYGHSPGLMKTPLSAVRAAVEMLEEAELDPTSRGLVAVISDAGAQMERQLQALRQAAAAREPGHHGMCRLDAVVPSLAAAHSGLRVAVEGCG